MKTVFYIIIFGFFVINACNRNKTTQIELENHNDTEIIRFEDTSPTAIEISTILDSLDFIFLDSEKAGFIDGIDKVIFHNNEIYLLDSRQQMILVFDSEGVFLRKIAKQGRGPGEYPYLGEFSLQNDTILILNRDIVYKYDLSGNFIESINLEFVPSNFECSSQFYYFYRGANVHFNDEDYYYDLIKCDTNGNIISMHFPYGQNDTQNISTDSPFYKSGGELYFVNGAKPSNSHMVYSLLDHSYQPFPKYEIIRNSSHPFVLGNFFETESTLIFNVICQTNSGNVVISKIDRTALIYNTVSADSQFLFKGGTVEFSNDSYFLTKFDASVMGMEIKDNEKVKSLLMQEFPQYEAFLKHIENENINPILIKEYYKPRLEK